MKKLTVTLIALMLTMTALQAQTAIDDLYKKYAGTKGMTSINISPEMFSFIANIDMDDSSEQAKDTKDVIEQLTGLKMLVYEPENGQTNVAFMAEIKQLSKVKGYTELMSVDGNDEVIKFLAKKNSEGKVTEMLMIVFEEDEAVVMSMTGTLDMKSISKISETLDIQGMEHLEEIK